MQAGSLRSGEARQPAGILPSPLIPWTGNPLRPLGAPRAENRERERRAKNGDGYTTGPGLSSSPIPRGLRDSVWRQMTTNEQEGWRAGEQG